MKCLILYALIFMSMLYYLPICKRILYIPTIYIESFSKRANEVKLFYIFLIY